LIAPITDLSPFLEGEEEMEAVDVIRLSNDRLLHKNLVIMYRMDILRHKE
jgi:hypothetical protein